MHSFKRASLALRIAYVMALPLLFASVAGWHHIKRKYDVECRSLTVREFRDWGFSYKRYAEPMCGTSLANSPKVTCCKIGFVEINSFEMHPTPP